MGPKLCGLSKSHEGMNLLCERGSDQLLMPIAPRSMKHGRLPLAIETLYSGIGGMPSEINLNEDDDLDGNFALLNTQLPEDVIRECNQVLEFYPDNFLALSYRALGYIKVERWVFAIQDAKRAIEINPRYKSPYLHLGYALYRSLDFDGASKYLSQLLRIDAELVEGRCRRADLHFQRHDYEKALEDLNFTLQKTQSYAASFLIAKIYVLQNRLQEALIEFKSLLRIDRRDHVVYFWRARVKILLHEFDDVDDDLSAAIRYASTPKKAYIRVRFDCRHRSCEYHSAALLYQKAVNIDPAAFFAYSSHSFSASFDSATMEISRPSRNFEQQRKFPQRFVSLVHVYSNSSAGLKPPLASLVRSVSTSWQDTGKETVLSNGGKPPSNAEKP